MLSRALFYRERKSTPAKERTRHDQDTFVFLDDEDNFDIRNIMNKKISRQSISDPKRMSMKIMITPWCSITGITKSNISLFNAL